MCPAFGTRLPWPGGGRRGLWQASNHSAAAFCPGPHPDVGQGKNRGGGAESSLARAQNGGRRLCSGLQGAKVGAAAAVVCPRPHHLSCCAARSVCICSEARAEGKGGVQVRAVGRPSAQSVGVRSRALAAPEGRKRLLRERTCCCCCCHILSGLQPATSSMAWSHAGQKGHTEAGGQRRRLAQGAALSFAW